MPTGSDRTSTRLPYHRPCFPLERASKTAATTSVLLILALMLVVHPDMTWLLRGLTVVALVAGWFVSPWALACGAGRTPFFWLFIAAIAPALLRLLAGREGPVLDIVWMAGLAGSLLRTTQWSRWTMPFPWNVLIGGWTLALSLSWPVLVAREVGFRLAGFFDAGAVNSWSLMSAPQAASWMLYVVLAQLIGALWFEWAREKAAQVQSPIVLNGLWAGATAASVVAVLQGTINIGLLSNAVLGIAASRDGHDARRQCVRRMRRARRADRIPRHARTGAARACRRHRGLRHQLRRHVAVWITNGALFCGLVGTGALLVGLWRERRSAPSIFTATRPLDRRRRSRSSPWC